MEVGSVLEVSIVLENQGAVANREVEVLLEAEGDARTLMVVELAHCYGFGRCVLAPNLIGQDSELQFPVRFLYLWAPARMST